MRAYILNMIVSFKTMISICIKVWVCAVMAGGRRLEAGGKLPEARGYVVVSGSDLLGIHETSLESGGLYLAEFGQPKTSFNFFLGGLTPLQTPPLSRPEGLRMYSTPLNDLAWRPPYAVTVWGKTQNPEKTQKRGQTKVYFVSTNRLQQILKWLQRIGGF